jgi:hypothetical protein
MKSTFIFLFLIGSSLIIHAQLPTCKELHLHEDHFISHFKSGNESLRSDTVNIINYDIYMDFTNADAGTISANCEIKFSPLLTINSISFDLLQLNIDSIIYHGNQITYNYNDTLIVAQFGATINAGAIDSLTIYYDGTPQTDPSGWGGFYMTGGYYYNLGVGFESDPHNYGRVWHPCFDNFVERATYHFEILTDDGNTAYCNGTRNNVVSVGIDSLMTTWTLNTEIPSYLASVAVSSYTHVSQNYFSTLQSLNIPVWLASHAADTNNLKSSFVHLPDAMSSFENSYGPFVWERVGYVLVPFNSGAMEHATNIAYPLLTVNGTTAYEDLMAHELSHHWWGDWVTCETAEEMWINEGMAKYSEHLFNESVYGYDEYMNLVRANHYDVLHKAHINDSGYYALNAVPVKYTYGDHSYNKGADAVHTMRSYFGDAGFFNALQSVQNTYGGGNISSEEFMNHCNSLGLDATSFFNAWILQPGFANFSITEFTVTPNGTNYDINVVVDQKMKGGASFHQNVPLELTFMDDNWNTVTQNISMSGDYAAFNFTLSINPVFVGVNLNEKINDATTAIHDHITETGVLTWNYANVRFTVTDIQDSAFVRIEHNWVYPDQPGAPDNIQINQSRYWNVHGVDLDNVEGTLRFEYNGKSIPSGNLDNNLMVDVAGQTFSEDSLVLLYRPDDHADWQIHTDYSVNYSGSHTDKGGFMTANFFAAGQYTFGYRTNSVGIKEINQSDRLYAIYPNPADDSLIIDLTSWDSENLILQIVGMEGKLALKKNIQGSSKNMIDISDLGDGAYLILISDATGQTLGSKRIIVE